MALVAYILRLFYAATCMIQRTSCSDVPFPDPVYVTSDTHRLHATYQVLFTLNIYATRPNTVATSNDIIYTLLGRRRQGVR